MSADGVRPGAAAGQHHGDAHRAAGDQFRRPRHRWPLPARTAAGGAIVGPAGTAPLNRRNTGARVGERQPAPQAPPPVGRFGTRGRRTWRHSPDVRSLPDDDRPVHSKRWSRPTPWVWSPTRYIC